MSHFNENPTPIGLSTEEDVASFLINNPQFFERFAEVLETVQLPDQYGGRVLSLHERQTSLLRERIKGLEATIIDMMSNSSDNAHIVYRTHQWALALLSESDPRELVELLTHKLQSLFNIPQVYLRLWDLDALYTMLPQAQEVHDPSKQDITNLEKPYCGPRGSVEGLQKLAGDEADLTQVQSIALLPLRVGILPEPNLTFGYLLLMSTDVNRFTPEHGTELLSRIAEIASAAMQRLLPQESVDFIRRQIAQLSQENSTTFELGEHQDEMPITQPIEPSGLVEKNSTEKGHELPVHQDETCVDGEQHNVKDSKSEQEPRSH